MGCRHYRIQRGERGRHPPVGALASLPQMRTLTKKIPLPPYATPDGSLATLLVVGNTFHFNAYREIAVMDDTALLTQHL